LSMEAGRSTFCFFSCALSFMLHLRYPTCFSPLRTSENIADGMFSLFLACSEGFLPSGHEDAGRETAFFSGFSCMLPIFPPLPSTHRCFLWSPSHKQFFSFTVVSAIKETLEGSGDPRPRCSLSGVGILWTSNGYQESPTPSIPEEDQFLFFLDISPLPMVKGEGPSSLSPRARTLFAFVFVPSGPGE